MRQWILVVALVAALPRAAVAEEVELISGEVLKAAVVERTSDNLVLEHPLLGRLEIGADNVKEVRPDAPPPEPGPETEAPPEPEKPAAPPAEPPPAWEWSIRVGAKGETGNSESHNINTAVEGLFENREHRWKLLQTWDFAKSEGDRTSNKYRTQVVKDWLQPNSRWFSFAGATYDWDEFQQWDGRITLAGGAGYEFIKTDVTRFIGRVGLTGVKETGVPRSRDAYRTELLLGVEGKWKLSKAQKISADTFVYPDLTDGGEYRVITNFAWSFKFLDTENLSLQVGFRNEYDTHTERPFDKNEFEYFIALLYEF